MTEITAAEEVSGPKGKGGRRHRDVTNFTAVEWVAPEGDCCFCSSPLRIAQHRERHLQTLTQRLAVQTKDRQCSCSGCQNFTLLYRPMEEVRLSLNRCGYGLDVVCMVAEQYIGQNLSLPNIHRLLTEKYGIQISQSHVGNLLRLGLALVHCRDVNSEHLRARLHKQGGIILSADAVNFDESSPAFYVLRDVLSGEVLCSQRLELRGSQELQSLFAAVKAINIPVLGIISDKEAAIVDAAKTVFPDVPHQFCQVHFLQNLAKPMDSHLSHVTAGVRTIVREVRNLEKSLLKQNVQSRPETPPSQRASELDAEIAALGHPEFKERQNGNPEPDKQAGEERKIVLKFCRVVQSLGKSRGENLLDPTPLKRLDRLNAVAKTVEKAVARSGGPWSLLTRLLTMFALSAFFQEHADFAQRQVAVLRHIAHILKLTHSGQHVKDRLQAYLDGLRAELSEQDKKSGWADFVSHVQAVSQRFWVGLFHCYDQPLLPSHNNDLEGFFGAIKRFSRKVTGRMSTSGGPLETCAEFFVEAFSIIQRDPQLLPSLSGIPNQELQRAREEFEKLAKPARLKRSIARDPDQALDQILAEWDPEEAPA